MIAFNSAPKASTNGDVQTWLTFASPGIDTSAPVESIHNAAVSDLQPKLYLMIPNDGKTFDLIKNLIAVKQRDDDLGLEHMAQHNQAWEKINQNGKIINVELAELHAPSPQGEKRKSEKTSTIYLCSFAFCEQ